MAKRSIDAAIAITTDTWPPSTRRNVFQTDPASVLDVLRRHEVVADVELTEAEARDVNYLTRYRGTSPAEAVLIVSWIEAIRSWSPSADDDVESIANILRSGLGRSIVALVNAGLSLNCPRYVNESFERSVECDCDDPDYCPFCLPANYDLTFFSFRGFEPASLRELSAAVCTETMLKNELVGVLPTALLDLI